jgi:predicted DsbA family dithiol-disulfide isomerase
VEVERLAREWDVVLDWAPFFLDPSIPPEGRTRTPQTTADTPKSALEERGERLNIEFRRGRTFTPNTHLALEAAYWSRETSTPEQDVEFHYALYRAFFTEHRDLSNIDVLVELAAGVNLNADDLRDALTTGRYRAVVDQGIEHSYAIGVPAIPTFIINDQYAIVGAQEYDVLERVMAKLGGRKRDGSPGPSADEIEFG